MSLLGDALDLLRRYGDVVGVDWDDKPGILDRAANTVTAVTGSPILAAAQITIQGMKATTGSGEPQAVRRSRSQRICTRRPATCSSMRRRRMTCGMARRLTHTEAPTTFIVT